MNKYIGNKDVMLMEYDDVIRSISFGVLKFLIQNKKTYVNMVDYERFEHLDDANLLRFAMQRQEKNILREVLLPDKEKVIDVDGTYESILKRDSIYTHVGGILDMYELIPQFINMRNIKVVYIYSDNDHDIIPLEIVSVLIDSLNHNLAEFKYISGDFINVIEEIKPTLCMLSDLNKVVDIDNPKVEIAVAQTGYNMVVDNDKGELVMHPLLTHLVEKEHRQIVYITTKKMTEKYFTQ